MKAIEHRMPPIVQIFSLLQIILMLQVPVFPLLGSTDRFWQDRAHHELQLHDGTYGEVCVSFNTGFSSKKSLQAHEVTSEVPASSSDSFQSSYSSASQEGVSLFSSFLLRTISTSSDL